MQKKIELHWTMVICPVMLCALCLISPLLAGDADSSLLTEPAGPEAVDAITGNDRKIAELQAALIQSQRELERLRQRYAELYLRSRKQADELEEIQLRLAGWLTDEQAVQDERALAEALAYLEMLQDSQRHFYRQVREFGRYLEAALEILQPSEGLRREIRGRFEPIVALADRLERVPSKVAGRDGAYDRTRRQCRVLAVNDELQIAVLDAGSIDGVRPGSSWRIIDGSRVLGLVTVIEVRPALSAAMPAADILKRISPGMQARLALTGEGRE
jgi:hypothetical protein